ncbi:MAG TPA: hypothetical protein VF432_05450 [Thermoanaerobaculia bacterium]
MNEEQLIAMIAALRDKAAAEMRELLRTASPPVLQKIAVDIVPALLRIASYAGEPFDRGENFGEAVARSRVAGLPAILVRVHRGPFGPADGNAIAASMRVADVSQVAVAFIADRAVNVAPYIGAEAQWVLDLDGLINLMLASGLGVTQRTYDAKYVDAPYFQ